MLSYARLVPVTKRATDGHGSFRMGAGKPGGMTTTHMRSFDHTKIIVGDTVRIWIRSMAMERLSFEATTTQSKNAPAEPLALGGV